MEVTSFNLISDVMADVEAEAQVDSLASPVAREIRIDPASYITPPFSSAKKEHPLFQRIYAEVQAFNEWISLNRGWDLVARNYTLANKIPFLANPELYHRAVTASRAFFIDEIRFDSVF